MFSEIKRENLAKNLKALRKSAGYTQQEVADIIGIKRGTYAKIETGVAFGSFETIIRASELFGVSVEALMGTKNSAYIIRTTNRNITEFEAVCNKSGINGEATINLFLKNVIKQGKIPFEIFAEAE